MKNNISNSSIKPLVFWPPFLLLLGAVIFSFVNEAGFAAMTTGANNWLIENFGWAFSMTGFLMVLIVLVIYFSPFAKVKIGGSKAKPLLNKWQWFSITLCTTIAIGILFWGTAEPIYHLVYPPASLGLEPGSAEAAIFAMSTMYLHWTFTPYALYCVPALMFAFAYYNMKKPFSLGSTLTPIAGDKAIGKAGQAIDAICLYALVAGMAASLATGILTISGGLNSIAGIGSNPFTWAIIGAAIIGTFIVSATTGLMRGIRILSDINTKVFFGIIAFIFVFGPTAFLLNLGAESFGHYLTHFFEKNLFTGAAAGDQWPQWWTTFYWANWLAWAPITALFLGRISYGHTVKDFIKMNFFFPAIFGAIWITVFSATSINFQMNGVDLLGALTNVGPEAVGFTIFRQLPISALIIPFFLFIAFLAFVTAADSNTTAMGGISTSCISPDSPEPPTLIKVVWGLTVGIVAWVMLSFAGIDGIKMLSNLGGFPAMILELAVAVGLILVVSNPRKFDTFKEDYYADGTVKPIITDNDTDTTNVPTGGKTINS
ncbi:BCCT family transporter [Desulfitibacter alkalitolerans]|uniref:BCCT family transporter n=1 Tax=Desulfitibacter alkalitolerans TaxID=264641 RepID=UPI0004870560|nr:BCCT family transporter [Desulfitibacter alkalitolerans]